MMHRRRTAAFSLVAVLGLTVSACGGGDTKTAPSESASVTASETPTPSASPTPTPTPSPTVKPLSKFEDQAPVTAARQWAAAIAMDVNNKDKTYPAAGGVSTKKARGYMGDFTNEDIGFTYPGPYPFTPTRVITAGDTATVSGCFWNQGWAKDPATGLPARKREIRRENVVLKKVGGVWKFDDFINQPGDCSTTPVKGLPFP